MQCELCSLFTIEDSAAYSQCYENSRTEISDHCLNSRIAWNAGFYYQVIKHDECIALVSNGGIFTTPHVTFPLGSSSPEKLELLIDVLWPVFQSHGWPFRLMYIDECHLPMVQHLRKYQTTISYNPDFSDYLYEAEALRSLRGKALHRKRNHFNRFCRLYPEYEYRQLLPDDERQALALVQDWCDEKDVDCLNLCQSDYRAIRQLFRHMSQLDVYGGALYVHDKMIAFSMGSLIHGDTAVIHFEKADPAYDGSYAAINKLMMEQTFPDAIWVNREEDMGVPGLRKAKESYGPQRLIHKYEAHLIRQ
ncbi:MAG: DUF2156 domain-containing protein [Clostridiaceae bacterium]|nr:DUF2156 domain-containing protein [Clostridiaceae bacterium]